MTDGTTTWTYAYDANGMRTSRSNGTTTYKYVYNGSSLVQMTVGSNTLYFTSDTVTFNGTTYYYVKNLQGDIVAILNSGGTAVVQYTYDAWGNILSMSDTSGVSLGTLNPLRYRGYVYDTETGLYYLQSRYYDPEAGRFINADSLATTGKGFVGNNMFAYCLNNPVNYVDSDGHDAIWVHESDSAGGFGHTGLLVQDDDGNWYYFYWGPESESTDILNLLGMLTIGTPSNCVLMRVEVGDSNLRSTEVVQEVLKNCDIPFIESRADIITDTYYFEGDYSPTLLFISFLKTCSDAGFFKYQLADNNCVQNAWTALSFSNSKFRTHCPVIPDIAYAQMLIAHGEYVMFSEFVLREGYAVHIAIPGV